VFLRRVADGRLLERRILREVRGDLSARARRHEQEQAAAVVQHPAEVDQLSPRGQSRGGARPIRSGAEPADVLRQLALEELDAVGALDREDAERANPVRQRLTGGEIVGRRGSRHHAPT
jgi:hypothetical protein